MSPNYPELVASYETRSGNEVRLFCQSEAYTRYTAASRNLSERLTGELWWELAGKTTGTKSKRRTINVIRTSFATRSRKSINNYTDTSRQHTREHLQLNTDPTSRRPTHMASIIRRTGRPTAFVIKRHHVWGGTSTAINSLHQL